MNETAVKEQGNNWDGLFPCSLLSSNHFTKTSLYIMALLKVFASMMSWNADNQVPNKHLV